MAATIEIDESNGSSETVTHNIANSNMGSADANYYYIAIAANSIADANWRRFAVGSVY